MKTLIALLLLCATSIAGDLKPQKFTMSVTITYDAVSLEGAAKIEKRIIKDNLEANSVSVKISDVPNVVKIGIDSIGSFPRWFRADSMDIVHPIYRYR